jgi:hypothetical protein
MQDKDLISKLQELRQIKPSQDWVVSLKKQIIPGKPGFRVQISSVLEVLPRLFQKKLAYATITLAAVLFGLFGVSMSTVPGDLLFPVRRIAEKSQGVLLSGADQSKYNLEIANKRLEELATIVRTNKTNNIASAIQEVKQSVADAAKDLNNNPQDLDETASQITNSATLAMLNNSQVSQISDALMPITVQQLIQSLEKTTLTENQQKTLVEVKDLYDKGNYNDALVRVLYLSHNSSN